MANPSQIGSDTNTREPYYTPVRCGPFEYSVDGNLFVVLQDEFNQVYNVWVSEDSGETWAKADGGNAPAHHADHFACNVYRDGNTLYVSYVNSSADISVKPFGMATGTWGSEIASGPTPSLLAITDSNIPSASKFHVIPRSDGSYVAFFQDASNVGGTNYARLYYAIRSSGGSWGSAVQVDSQSGAYHSTFVGATRGASDRIHMFWYDDQYDVFMHRSLSGSTLDNEQLIAASVYELPSITHVYAYEDACSNTYVTFGYGYWNKVSPVLAMTDPTTLKFAHIYARSEENPRFSCDISQAETDGPSDFGADRPAHGYFYDEEAATLYAFWCTKFEDASPAAGTVRLMHAANKGAGWGTPVELFDAGDYYMSSVYAEKINAGVGVVFASGVQTGDPGTDPYYIPHYWHGTLSATAPEACGGGGGATASSRGGMFSHI